MKLAHLPEAKAENARVQVRPHETPEPRTSLSKMPRHRRSRPVNSGDHKNVARTQEVEHDLKFGTAIRRRRCAWLIKESPGKSMATMGCSKIELTWQSTNICGSPAV